MMYVCNAFSLQMVDPEDWQRVKITAFVNAPDADTLAQCESAVGHADTAAVLGVPMNRRNVKLQRGDTLLIAQLIGGRLPEGCTELPDGFSFAWAKVTLE